VTAAEVYLPCDVGQVKVKVGFGDTLSPLEESALRVIAALSEPLGQSGQPSLDAVHRADIHEVAKLLGLGYRLVHDLWRVGYLVVDFRSNTIGLTSDVRDKLDNGQLATLAGTETTEYTVDLMVEGLTGYVMPSGGPYAPTDNQLALRFLGSETGLADASHADVELAVRGWLRQGVQRRQRRILSIRSGSADRATGPGRRWYQLAVQVEVNPDSERLIITVTDRRFPADRRDLASDRLTRLAEERPQESWVKQLRNDAERRLVTPPSLEDTLDRLGARIATGMTVPAGKRRAEHLDWAADSRRITGLIQDRIAHEVTTELIAGGEAHAMAVGQLIDEARTQLVIVSPRIADDAVERFRPQLQRAVDRGVQVVILWGGEYRAAIEGSVRNALDSLARRAKTAPMLRAQVSANTNARMVICDNRAALVTSRDVFATTRERHEIGLLLRRPDGQDGAALTDLLSWVRVTMPGSMSASVLRDANRFTRAALARQEQSAEPPGEHLPEEPPEDLEESGAVRAWILRWDAHLASLRAELARRPLPAVRLVEDGAHRELLWQAVRKAQRRVVIASGLLSDEVVNGRMIDAIDSLCGQGVAVTIGYDEQGGADRGRGALAALHDLAESHPALLTLYGRVGHSRALVCDDEVIVGSYSYLFHAGYGAVGGRHMLPSELSVRLTDPMLADQVAAACGEPAAVTPRTSGTTAQPPAGVEDVDPVALEIAQRVLNRAGGTPPGTLVRAELSATDEPWAVLDVLDRLADPEIRRAAIAYSLAYGDPDARTAARWRGRLINELAQAGLFDEARILRAGTPEDQDDRPGPDVSAPGPGMSIPGLDATPRPKVLLALSRLGEPGTEDVLLDAAFEEGLSADEKAALRTRCVGELLEKGSTDAKDALDVLSPGDGPWGDLGRLAMDYHEGAAGAPTVELMREVAGRRQAGTLLEAAWDRLELALIEAEPVAMQLDGAKKTKAALYKETGVLGQLRDMAIRRDLPALRALVSTEFGVRALPVDVADDLFARTWREVAPLRPLLVGKPRIKYVKRIGEVIAVARELASSGDTEGAGSAHDGRAHGDEDPSWRRPDPLLAARQLTEGYEGLRPALAEDAGAGPLATAVREAVLADLDRLMSGQLAEPEIVVDDDDGDRLARAAEAGGQLAGPGLAAVPPWPGQWQYPELAVALWAGDADPARAATLLLTGVIDPLSPAETAGRLIREGEFAAVEALRAAVPLPAQEAAALLRELQSAQAMAEARARYEAAALTRRAERAEFDARLDLDTISDQARRRRADAELALSEFSGRVIGAEEILIEKLRAAVEADPAVRAGVDEVTGADGRAVESWRRTVLACIAAREFPSARQMLSQRPGTANIHDPRFFSALRPIWPFPADIAETVVSWYFSSGPGMPPAFESWRPGRGDDAAWGMLEALNLHLGQGSTRSAGALRDSLQRLLGANYQAAAMTWREGGWAGRLYLPVNLRLPRLPLLGWDGIALWIGDSGNQPQGLHDPVIAWLVTDFGQPRDVPPGTVLIDLPFVFRLLAPQESELAIAETRLVNLVRHLGAQLDAGRLLGAAQPSATPFTDTDVAWLLDLLGAASDGVVAEALHYDAGGRREVLIPLIDGLLPPPVPGRGRYSPVDVELLREVWDSGTWREGAIDALLAPLAGDFAALVVAWVAVAFHDSAFTLDELPTEIGIVATREQAETFLRSVDAGDVARRLHRAGIFEPAHEDQWRLPANGIRELLAGVWPGHDSEARARLAIDGWFRHYERARAQSRADLSDDVVRTIGHWIANLVAAAGSAHARQDDDRAWEIVDGIENTADGIASIHHMYRRALEAEAALPLRDLLNDHRNQTEHLNPAFEVELPSDAELAGLYVFANRWLLGHALQNLLDNARQAFESRRLEFGKARVRVTVDGQPGEADRTCRIDIEDDGPGMSHTAREEFAAGEESSSGRGRGTGLQTASRWFGEYRGTLEIMPGRSELGGAWLRVTLPLCAPPEA
jgi:Histidine kinase-, DNA gyrase B-, and HSP90-like ATPase